MIGSPQHNKHKIIATGYDGESFELNSHQFNDIQTHILSKLSALHITPHKDFTESLTMSLIKQSHSDRNNPYVEHGHPHALRVGDNMVKLLSFIKSNQTDALQGITVKMGLNNDHPALPFIFWLTGVLHDCNYYIDCSQGEVKTVHALKSALVAYDVLNGHLKTLLNENDQTISQIIETMTDAILCHNGDTGNDSFSNTLESPIGEIPYNNLIKLNRIIHHCLSHDMAHAFINACYHHDKLTMGRRCHHETWIGIPLRDANIRHNPFLFLVRLADDFDSTHQRLLPIQKKCLNQLLPYAKYYMEMHMHYQNLPVGDWPWHIILRQFEQTTLLNSEGKEFLNRIINKDPHVHDPNRSFQGFYNPQMRFYIGLWLVDEINLIPTPSSLGIEVSIRSSSDVERQTCIDFYRHCIAKFDKGDETIPLESYYGQRILRKGMSLSIQHKKNHSFA